jgi:hypothetical protein
MRSVLTGIVLWLAVPVFAGARDSGVLFLVRHAELDASGEDAALLNATGEQRALTSRTTDCENIFVAACKCLSCLDQKTFRATDKHCLLGPTCANMELRC